MRGVERRTMCRIRYGAGSQRYRVCLEQGGGEGMCHASHLLRIGLVGYRSAKPQHTVVQLPLSRALRQASDQIGGSFGEFDLFRVLDRVGDDAVDDGALVIDGNVVEQAPRRLHVAAVDLIGKNVGSAKQARQHEHGCPNGLQGQRHGSPSEHSDDNESDYHMNVVR